MTEISDCPDTAEWDFCPETLLGLGSHSYSEWEPLTVQVLGGKTHRWDVRACRRCGKKDYRRVAVPK